MKCTQSINGSAGPLLPVYLREINDQALLSPQEERALAEAIARGDTDARTRMIQANLRLVVKIARGYTGRGMVLEDLIGEGNVGLIKAVEAFQTSFGTRFSTYASFWIKQSIRNAIINTATMIRLPSHIVGLLTKWRRAERTIARQRGCEPTFNEVASFLGLSDMQRDMMAKAHQALQLKLESGIVAETGRWLAADAAGPCESPDAALELNEKRCMLMSRMQRLDNRERTILTLRYGLGGTSPHTLNEISQRLRVTREWVRKIELRAVRKLSDDGATDSSEEWDHSRSRRSIQRFRTDSAPRPRATEATSAPNGNRAVAQLHRRCRARTSKLHRQTPAAAAAC
jgi:RNA polymerase primary sigma factor